MSLCVLARPTLGTRLAQTSPLSLVRLKMRVPASSIPSNACDNRPSPSRLSESSAAVLLALPTADIVLDAKSYGATVAADCACDAMLPVIGGKSAFPGHILDSIRASSVGPQNRPSDQSGATHHTSPPPSVNGSPVPVPTTFVPQLRGDGRSLRAGLSCCAPSLGPAGFHPYRGPSPVHRRGTNAAALAPQRAPMCRRHLPLSGTATAGRPRLGASGAHGRETATTSPRRPDAHSGENA